MAFQEKTNIKHRSQARNVLKLSYWRCSLALDGAAPATAVPYNPLFNKTTPGIASFLQGNANYSSFLSLVQSDPMYSQLLKGDWAKVSNANGR